MHFHIRRTLQQQRVASLQHHFSRWLPNAFPFAGVAVGVLLVAEIPVVHRGFGCYRLRQEDGFSQRHAGPDVGVVVVPDGVAFVLAGWRDGVLGVAGHVAVLPGEPVVDDPARGEVLEGERLDVAVGRVAGDGDPFGGVGVPHLDGAGHAASLISVVPDVAQVGGVFVLLDAVAVVVLDVVVYNLAGGADDVHEDVAAAQQAVLPDEVLGGDHQGVARGADGDHILLCEAYLAGGGVVGRCGVVVVAAARRKRHCAANQGCGHRPLKYFFHNHFIKINNVYISVSLLRQNEIAGTPCG